MYPDDRQVLDGLTSSLTGTESRMGRICVGLLAHRAHGLDSRKRRRTSAAAAECLAALGVEWVLHPVVAQSRCQLAVSHPAAAT